LSAGSDGAAGSEGGKHARGTRGAGGASEASGTKVALVFAFVVGLGVALVAVYKATESGRPPVAADFQHLAVAPANATVHDLDFRAVHSRDSFLEDHLATALQHGTSHETDRLRVEQMRATLDKLAGTDATLVVRWEGQVVQVTFSGLA
jgi:hypothetical protein